MMTGYILKIIASIAMLIDHAGVAFRPLMSYNMYRIMRHIGRMAFPLYAFLIVEGFHHTKNKKKYLAGMVIFAAISEFPFDILFNTGDFSWGAGQNVYFTLSLGLMTVWVCDILYKKVKETQNYWINALIALVYLAGMGLGDLCVADYASFGVMLIELYDVFYRIGMSDSFMGRRFEDVRPEKRKMEFAALALLIWFAIYDLSQGHLIEFYGIPAVFLLMAYNGKRGRVPFSKWAFYLYYPVHILLLYWLRTILV